jgi:hypothetical protein
MRRGRVNPGLAPRAVSHRPFGAGRGGSDTSPVMDNPGRINPKQLLSAYH